MLAVKGKNDSLVGAMCEIPVNLFYVDILGNDALAMTKEQKYELAIMYIERVQEGWREFDK